MTGLKSIHINLPKDVENNQKHETKDFLAKHSIKNKSIIVQIQTWKRYPQTQKTVKQIKFALNLSQRLDLRSSNKYVV